MGAGVDALQRVRPARRVPHHRTADVRRAGTVPDLRPGARPADLGGIVDVSPDASPIVGLTPVDGLYLNCGWGTGGFKATPGIGSCLPTPSPTTRRTALRRAVHPGPVHHRRAWSTNTAPPPSPTELRERDHRCISSPARGADPVRRSSSTTADKPHVAYPAEPADAVRSTTGPSTCSSGTTPRARSPSAGATPPAAAAGSTPSATPSPTNSWRLPPRRTAARPRAGQPDDRRDPMSPSGSA